MALNEALQARVHNDFILHPANEVTAPLYDANRASFEALAHEIVDRCPQSRELSLALTALEEAMFWSNAAIARN